MTLDVIYKKELLCPSWIFQHWNILVSGLKGFYWFSSFYCQHTLQWKCAKHHWQFPIIFRINSNRNFSFDVLLLIDHFTTCLKRQRIICLLVLATEQPFCSAIISPPPQLSLVTSRQERRVHQLLFHALFSWELSAARHLHQTFTGTFQIGLCFKLQFIWIDSAFYIPERWTT